MSPQKHTMSVSPDETASLGEFIRLTRRSLAAFRQIDFHTTLPPSSDLAEDDKYLDGSKAVHPEIHKGGYPLSSYCHHLLGAASDNLASLLAMISNTSGTNQLHVEARRSGPYAVIRASIEASAQVCWLLTPPSNKQRAVRRMCLWADEINYKEWAVKSFDKSSRAVLSHAFDLFDKDHMRPAEWQEIHQRAKDQMKKEKRAYKSIAGGIEGALGNVDNDRKKCSFSTLLNSLEDDYSWMHEGGLFASWQVCSALSHGKQWGYSAFSSRELIEDRPGQNTKIYAESINYTNMSNMGALAVAMLSQAVDLYKKRSAPQL